MYNLRSQNRVPSSNVAQTCSHSLIQKSKVRNAPPKKKKFTGRLKRISHDSDSELSFDVDELQESSLMQTENQKDPESSFLVDNTDTIEPESSSICLVDLTHQFTQGPYLYLTEQMDGQCIRIFIYFFQKVVDLDPSQTSTDLYKDHWLSGNEDSVPLKTEFVPTYFLLNKNSMN